MRRITLIASLLFLFAGSSFAQNDAGAKGPVVTLTGLPTLKKMDGDILAASTTREYITKNPTLVVDPPTCKIVGFSVTITAGKNKPWGPISVTGSNFSREIIDKIKETKGPGVIVKVDNIRVNNQGFITSNVKDLILKYDQ